jgi:hypothetical protein
MKSIRSSLSAFLTMAAVCSLACAPLTSCQGMVTKQDAKELAGEFAKDAMGIAFAKLTNSSFDSKAAFQDLGFRLANKAMLTVSKNILVNDAPPMPAPEEVVTATLNQAKQEILQSNDPDPQKVSLAVEIAVAAADVALTELEAPPRPSGK